jgi:hypothetical protein
MSWLDEGPKTQKLTLTEAALEPENTDDRAAPKQVAFLKAPAVSLDSIFDAGFWREGEEG